LLMRALSARIRIGTRRGVITTPAGDPVLEYLQEHVPPSKNLVVYPYLPLYNYLTDTSSPTRYDYFQPGMNTTQQAREMLAELASRRVPCALFEASFPEKISKSWPATPLGAIANDPVADYMLKHYRTCKVLTSPESWRFLFMVGNDFACP
jgi:hypothetical protein